MELSSYWSKNKYAISQSVSRVKRGSLESIQQWGDGIFPRRLMGLLAARINESIFTTQTSLLSINSEGEQQVTITDRESTEELIGNFELIIFNEVQN